VQIEGRNREQYYKAVEAKAGEFYKKASAYLLAGYYGRRPTPEDVRARNALVAEHKLDRDVYQTLRIQPRQASEAVFLPLFKFGELPKDQFAAKADELLAAVKTGEMPAFADRRGRVRRSSTRPWSPRSRR
jgi:hypothetical protein